MTPSFQCRHCETPLQGWESYCPECGSSQSAGLIVRVVSFLIDLTLWLSLTGGLVWLGFRWLAFIAAWIALVEIGYQLEGSIGKALLGLSVNSSGRRNYYFRETVGKFASFATFGIGFLLVFSKNRLALHDYMARTQVVAARPRPLVIRTAKIIGFLILVGFAAYLGAQFATPRVPSTSAVPVDPFSKITRQMAAVLTIYIYDRNEKLIGQGSGFILKPDGLSATNFHVLEEAYRAEASLGDGRIFHVLRIQAYDKDLDVALFQLGREIGKLIEWPDDLPVLTPGSSSTLRIGDRIVTVSSPKGLTNTLTDGLVSSIRQNGPFSILQISAPISPGSSGAPVFDLAGRVIGMASFQLREGQNLNFAIPVESLTNLLDRTEDLTFDEFKRQIHPINSIPPQISSTRIFGQGVRLYNAGLFNDALAKFLAVEESNPENSAAYYNAALCYKALGLRESAALEYSMFLIYASSDDPNRARAINWLTENGYQE